jgi:hypothetical protein
VAHVGIFVGENINTLYVFFVEYFREGAFSFGRNLEPVLMKVGPIISKKVQNGLIVDFGHIVVEVADEGLIAGVQLELVNLILLDL